MKTLVSPVLVLTLSVLAVPFQVQAQTYVTINQSAGSNVTIFSGDNAHPSPGVDTQTSLHHEQHSADRRYGVPLEHVQYGGRGDVHSFAQTHFGMWAAPGDVPSPDTQPTTNFGDDWDPNTHAIDPIPAQTLALNDPPAPDAPAPAKMIAPAHRQPQGPQAPADEYFGNFNTSVLGIRNVLNDVHLSAQTVDDTIATTQLHRLLVVEDAMHDWHDKYPQDTWLPTFGYSLLIDYRKVQAQFSDTSNNAATPRIALLTEWLEAGFPGYTPPTK